MTASERHLTDGAEIVVYKNNSDGKGQSYGCHENYMLARSVPFGRIVTNITPHFITRQIFCGAGKVGCEAGLGTDDLARLALERRRREDATLWDMVTAGRLDGIVVLGRAVGDLAILVRVS